MIRVKVCGLTRAEDVHAAVAAGVDACGFNLARGPRRIDPERARELAALLPPFCTAVGLFVDADAQTVLAAMRASRCQVIQLHGQEPPEFAAHLRAQYPVIKAFAVRDAASLAAIADYPADAYLLDAHVPGLAGGTGTAWDHGLLAGCALRRPVILAGGLTPENVAAAAALRPWGVDTASGVEAGEPGVKDHARMARFVAAARRGNDD
ncbi:MAG: phosphoribosylanthranilate isomerase [Planctomycetota bacterium]